MRPELTLRATGVPVRSNAEAIDSVRLSFMPAALVEAASARLRPTVELCDGHFAPHVTSQS